MKNKADLIEEAKKEFRGMRRLMGYGDIWKFHSMGVAMDIDIWLEEELDQIYQAGVEAGVNGMWKLKAGSKLLPDRRKLKSEAEKQHIKELLDP